MTPTTTAEATKICSKCGAEKPESEFYVYRDKRRGGIERVMAKCKSCHSRVAMDWKKRNPYRARMADKRYHQRLLRRKRLRRYSLTEFEMAYMEANQQGLCALCGEHVGDALVIDHDHATGDVRGLLCNVCNVGLGAFADDPKRLLRAIHYLLRYERRRSAAAS